MNFQIKSRNEEIFSLEADIASHKDSVNSKELALNKLQIESESTILRLEASLTDRVRDIELLQQKV